MHEAINCHPTVRMFNSAVTVRCQFLLKRRTICLFAAAKFMSWNLPFVPDTNFFFIKRGCPPVSFMEIIVSLHKLTAYIKEPERHRSNPTGSAARRAQNSCPTSGGAAPFGSCRQPVLELANEIIRASHCHHTVEICKYKVFMSNCTLLCGESLNK